MKRIHFVTRFIRKYGLKALTVVRGFIEKYAVIFLSLVVAGLLIASNYAAQGISVVLKFARNHASLLLFVVAGLFMIGGATVFTGYVISERVQAEAFERAMKNASEATPAPELAAEVIKGIPVKIEVPELGISNTVKKGYYNAENGEWTLDDFSAFFATMTSPANDSTGNTFIYGHNADNIFGPLKDAKVGMKAQVTTDNGYLFTYTLKSFKAVDPTDVSLIQPTKNPTLTLQTCSGSWYQFRSIYTFTFDQYYLIDK